MNVINNQATWFKPLYEVRLDNGLPVMLENLLQWRTYQNLGEGYPDEDINQLCIDDARSRAMQAFGSEPYLLSAEETAIDRNDADALGDEASLPVVTCVGRFSCATPVHEQGDLSELVILWYQHELAMPIADDILHQLIALDWNSLATDFDY